ncbi:hypothetical protein [Planococcus lenghuensis]|nr:hypothetical protein [Planococcus lenghuensis]
MNRHRDSAMKNNETHAVSAVILQKRHGFLLWGDISFIQKLFINA